MSQFYYETTEERAPNKKYLKLMVLVFTLAMLGNFLSPNQALVDAGKHELVLQIPKSLVHKDTQYLQQFFINGFLIHLTDSGFQHLELQANGNLILVRQSGFPVYLGKLAKWPELRANAMKLSNDEKSISSESLLETKLILPPSTIVNINKTQGPPLPRLLNDDNFDFVWTRKIGYKIQLQQGREVLEFLMDQMELYLEDEWQEP